MATYIMPSLSSFPCVKICKEWLIQQRTRCRLLPRSELGVSACMLRIVFLHFLGELGKVGLDSLQLGVAEVESRSFLDHIMTRRSKFSNVRAEWRVRMLGGRIELKDERISCIISGCHPVIVNCIESGFAFVASEWPC